MGRAGLGSLLAIAAEGGPPSPLALRTITAIRDHLIRLPIPLEALQPLEPAQLAAAVPEPEWRQRILRGMTVLALLESDAGEARLARLEATARALHIDDAPVRAFRHVLEHQFNLVRLDIARRGFQKGAALRYLHDEGPAGALQIARSVLKREDPALARRYRGLEHGLGVTRDLISNWDPWDDFPQPLEEVRRRYGIRPRESSLGTVPGGDVAPYLPVDAAG
jgi:hypothetical protein